MAWRSAVPLVLLWASMAGASLHQSASHGQTRFRFDAKDGNSMIDKIVQMLEEEKDKIKMEVQEEAKEMKEYFQYCKDEKSEKGYTIKTATRKIDDLTSLIDSNSAEIKALEEQLAELGTEQAERSDEMAKAEKVRSKQHEEFLVREEQQRIMVEELEQMGIELKHQIAAMTTPPPVFMQEDGHADTSAEAAADE